MLLITGASGLLGANLSLVAAAEGRSLALVTRGVPIALPQAVTIQADLTDQATARKVMTELKPRWVVHCAALTNVDQCQTHPEETWRVNVEMPRLLARIALEIGARFVYISTDSVFDGQVGDYAEDSPIAPMNVYAKSKADGEEAVRAELPDSMVVRTNIYGWNARNKGSLAEWVLGLLEKNQTVDGFADVHFSPISANDLSQLLCQMMDKGLTGLYNAAGSQPCSKFEFACRIAETFGFNPSNVKPCSIEDSKLKVPRPKNTSLNTTKLSTALGCKLPSVAQGLERFKELADSGFRDKLRALLAA